MADEIEEFLAAADRLAKARVRWAQAFLLARSRANQTDKQASAVADEMTGCETTVLEAELEVAKRRLR